MRTNIEIDDRLLAEAQRASGSRTKRETVDRALEALVQYEKRKEMLRFHGSGIWEGDLKALRRNRV